MTKTKISFKGLVFILVVMLLPFLFLSFFDFPSADDFSYAESKMTIGFWTTQLQMYFGWSGRYVSTALLSVSPLAFGTLTGYNFFGIFNVLLLITASYCFLRCVFKHVLTGRELTIVILSATAILFAELPSPVEGFYWLSGFITYTWAFALFLFSLTLLCWQQGWGFGRQPAKTSVTQEVLMVIFLSLSSFSIAGFNETLNITWIFVLFFAILYKRKCDPRGSRPLYYSLLFACLGLLISALAPGNKVREAQLGADHEVLRTTLRSLGLSIEILFRYLKVPFILGLFLATPYVVKAKDKVSPWFYSKRTRTQTFLLYAGLSFLFLAPAEWAMGHSPPRRALNMLCAIHIFSVSMMYFQYLWSRSDDGVRSLEIYNKIETRYFRSRGPIVFLISLLAFGNIGLSWYDLLFKTLPNNERIEIMARNQNKDVIFKPYSNPPLTLFFDDIVEDKEDWRNKSLAYYFGVKSVRLGSLSQDTSKLGR